MKYPFVIIKKVGGEWWYHGADKDLESASKVLFYLGQTSGSAVTDARIVEVKDQYQLDKLRETVNNLPNSLFNCILCNRNSNNAAYLNRG